MTSMRKRFQTFENMAREAGMDDPRVICSGRGHPKLHGQIGGRAIKIAVPSSPGKCRTLANMRATIRRIARGCQ